MTWEEMCKKHEDELKAFEDRISLADSVFRQSAHNGRVEKLQFDADWAKEYKQLVSRKFSEASQELHQESERKAYAKQIQQVINTGRANSEWVDQQIKALEQKKHDEYERLKKEVEEEVKKEQARKKSFDRER